MRGLRRGVGAEPHDRVPSGATAFLWRESRVFRVAKLHRGFSGSCLLSSADREFCESRVSGRHQWRVGCWAKGDRAAQMKPANSRATATTALRVETPLRVICW
jgi:hypothetical protein